MRVVGVALAVANTARHSISAMAAPAATSARRRRMASASASSSQPRISAADMSASELAAWRTSRLRAKGSRGLPSHHGLTPTVRTTARTPTLAPSEDLRSLAACSTWPRFPSWATWSTSGGVQQIASTTPPASTQRHSVRGTPAAPALRARSHQTVRPTRPTANAASAGGTKLSSHCNSKLVSSTATGSSRYSPQASDQHTKISASSGNRPAEGFQMS